MLSVMKLCIHITSPWSHVRNFMLAAGSDEWYFELITIVAGAPHALSISDIFLRVSQDSERMDMQEYNADDVLAFIAGALDYLLYNGIFEKTEAEGYQLTHFAREYIDLLL